MNTITNPDAHVVAADDLLAVMCNSRLEYETIRFEHGVLPGFMPDGFHRQMCQAVYELYENDKPIHDTLIKELAPKVPIEFINERMVLYDELRAGIVAKENSEIVRKHGLWKGTQRLLTIANAQLASDGVDARERVVNNLLSLLPTIGTNKQTGDVTPADHAKKNRELRNRVSLGSFGFPWLDKYPGYERGSIVFLGGAYKQRKTTLAINMLLAADMMGLNCAFLSGEMLQYEIQDYIESQLAVAHVYKAGLYGMQYSAQRADGSSYMAGYDWIAPKVLQRFYGSYDQWAPERYEALQWAERRYEQCKFRIYDSTIEHGNLRTWDDIRRVILADNYRYNGKIYFVDYMQLFQERDMSIYEHMSMTTREMQTFAKRQGICIVPLVQLNEDTIKRGSTYSPGTSGGGDAAQKATYYITTKYNSGDLAGNPDVLEICMKLARYGPQGDYAKTTYNIHPASGLILDAKWIEAITI